LLILFFFNFIFNQDLYYEELIIFKADTINTTVVYDSIKKHKTPKDDFNFSYSFFLELFKYKKNLMLGFDYLDKKNLNYAIYYELNNKIHTKFRYFFFLTDRAIKNSNIALNFGAGYEFIGTSYFYPSLGLRLQGRAKPYYTGANFDISYEYLPNTEKLNRLVFSLGVFF